MKILAVDSSGMTASVAILEDGIMKAEYSLTNKKTHSETLLPMIDRVVTDTNTDLESIDAIAIAAGPGSFTGLRIGAATVKGLALALEKPIVPVPTLAGMSYNLAETSGLIVPIMDARRNQVFSGIYRFEDMEYGGRKQITVREQDAEGIDELIGELNRMAADSGEKVTFLGDGVAVFKSYIAEHAEFSYCFAASMNSLQRAGSVAELAVVMMAEGKAVHGDDFAPIYLRKSQAEREREERAGKETE